MLFCSWLIHQNNNDELYSVFFHPIQINQIQKSVLKGDYEKNVLVPHFESALDDISSTEIEIFDGECDDDTVEVVMLNADDNFDDQHYEIEIEEDEQLHANDDPIDEKKATKDKLVIQSVFKKERKYTPANSTQQTRSSNSKNPKSNHSKPAHQPPLLHFDKVDVLLKEEECVPTASSSSLDDGKNVIYYDADDAGNASPPSKKRRGRPKASIKSEDAEDSETTQPAKKYTRRPKTATIMRKAHDLPSRDADEGESGDEFPARDSDNEDWPSQTTLDDFPTKIIENGLLLVKGKKLMSMICKYYKLECDLCEPKTRFKLV